MLKAFLLTGAGGLGALVLSACSGGGDDLVKVATVSPTVSRDALLDFGSSPVPSVSLTPQVIEAAPSPTSVPPTATPRPPAPPPSQPQTQQNQAPPPTATPLPPAPTNTPVPATAAPQTTNCPSFGAGGAPASGAPGQVFNYGGPVGAGGPGGSQGVINPGGGGPTVFGGGPDGLESFLGTTSAALQSELGQGGATQASVAAKHGKTRDQLKAFLIEQNRKLVSDQVAAGRMTQAQAQQFLNQYASDVDKLINSTFSGGGSAGGPGGGNSSCAVPAPGR